ncbi:uncharacterized protein LOC114322907 [Camellia sinensis]|uniref:uncharacterized protein LOC114322907 n=1 Tax=Camellia sinensis TaxID=4442 RepID=UPI001036AC3F|nr:uncharacterized protein LOC114322907 [Camellia sinensis]
MRYVDGRIQAPVQLTRVMTNGRLPTFDYGLLIHSMVPDIGEGYLSMETAQDVGMLGYHVFPQKGISPKHLSSRRSIESSIQRERWFFSTSPSSPTAGNALITCRTISLFALLILSVAFAYVQNEDSRRSAMMSPASNDLSGMTTHELEDVLRQLLDRRGLLLLSIIFLVICPLRYDHLRAKAYTDADWAGSVTDRRSTSGYYTSGGSNVVTWRSIDQTDSIRLYCDNKAAINIAH